MTPEEFQARCDQLRKRLSDDRRIKRKVRACPQCTGEDTIRKGFSAASKQMHFCNSCRIYFTGEFVSKQARQSVDSDLMCYRCGSTHTINQGENRYGGKSGHCQRCMKYFTQGGKLDLERYHLLLADRIAQLKLPSDVALELFQIASMDVLMGRGYCWTVRLNISLAYRACRGEYGQRGSDHWMYQSQNDNRPKKHEV